MTLKALQSIGGSSMTPALQQPTHIEAIVLIIEHRRCLCCRVEHTVSNPKLLARISVPIRGTRLLSLEKASAKFASVLQHTLPCERQHVYTTSEMCHLCFDNYEPGGQQELWPRELPEPDTKPARWKREKPAAPAPLTLTLKDF